MGNKEPTLHGITVRQRTAVGWHNTYTQPHLVVAHEGIHEVLGVSRQTHQHGYHSNTYSKITRIRVVYQTTISLIWIRLVRKATKHNYGEQLKREPCSIAQDKDIIQFLTTPTALKYTMGLTTMYLKIAWAGVSSSMPSLLGCWRWRNERTACHVFLQYQNHNQMVTGSDVTWRHVWTRRRIRRHNGGKGYYFVSQDQSSVL